MLLGAHVSIAGGVENAPPRAVAIQADVMQIFSKNQRQWKASPLSRENIDGYKKGVEAAKLGPTLVHCSYLLNCASADDAAWTKSWKGLQEEIERADALGIPFLTFHPGSPSDKGADFGCKRVGEAVTNALEAAKGTKTMVLLETNAGQGNAVGRTFNELAAMREVVPAPLRKRVGVCFDTCHVFVSGYAIHTEEGFADTFDTFENEIGLEWLKAFHLNDSLADFDSKKDRHAKIGTGKLGLEPFRWLLNDKRFKEIPGYLETPVEEESEYAGELKTLRKLLKK